MLIMIVLGSVKARKAAMPHSRPIPDSLDPPNGAWTQSMLTQLIPTIPESSSDDTLSARVMFSVKTPAIKPNLVEFAILTTSSSSLNRFTTATGPKISSLWISELVSTSTNTVGSIKYPWEVG